MSRNQPTGIFYAFGAAIALAASFVFSKSVLNHISMVHFGVLWFSLGVIWNGTWFLMRCEYRNLSGSFGKKTGVALVVAIFEGLGTGLFYLAINAMENPAVVSFIGNVGPVFVTLMGITLLRERFRQTQLTGIAITILGLFVINYRQGGFAGFTDPGAIYVIAASFFFSLATISGRKYRKYLHPGYMSLIRSFLLAAVMGILFFRQSGGGLFDLSGNIWRDLLLGSLLETMIVIVFAYQALKMIEATKTSAGGIMTLIGVGLITWNKPLIHRG